MSKNINKDNEEYTDIEESLIMILSPLTMFLIFILIHYLILRLSLWILVKTS